MCFVVRHKLQSDREKALSKKIVSFEPLKIANDFKKVNWSKFRTESNETGPALLWLVIPEIDEIFRNSEQDFHW